MALHIKSNKSFKILIGFSALCISLMAATFSITGISALFSGSHLTVAFMMGVLEFGKIVVASFLARFWEDLSKVFKTYFSISIIILVLITSAGIFGYLSDAYQKTKGNYDVISNDIQLYDKKIKLFSDERDRLTIQLKNQDNRLNTLYSDQNSLNRRIDNRIKNTESTYSTINKKLSATNDSISFYETSKVQKESLVSTGELGPLKYMSNIFNADMDTIVKYFIFMLIFVFDPLAVLLFISLNVIIKKEELERKKNKDEFGDDIISFDDDSEIEPIIVSPQTDDSIAEPKIVENTIETISEVNSEELIVDDSISNTKVDNVIDDIQSLIITSKTEPKINKKITTDNEMKDYTEEIVSEVEKKLKEDVEKQNQHTFYHGDEEKETSKVIGERSSNYKYEL